jgi:hypothetical protein
MRAATAYLIVFQRLTLDFDLRRKRICVHFLGHFYSMLGRLFENPDNFTGFGVPVQLRFLENWNAVFCNLKPSAS